MEEYFLRKTEKFIFPNKIIALEIEILPDGEKAVHCILFSIIKSEIKFEIVTKQILVEQKSLPVIVLVYGKGILTKNTNQKQYNVSELFNGIDNKEFYVQNTTVNNKCIDVNIIRKSVIDNFYNEFSIAQNRVLGITIGLSFLKLQKHLLENFPIHVSRFEIPTSPEDKIIEINNSVSHFMNWEIQSNIQLLFSLVLFYVSAYESVPGIKLIEFKEELYKNAIKKIGIILILSLLSLLILNFFSLNFLKSKNNNYNQQLQAYQPYFTQLAQINEDIANREEFINKLSLSKTLQNAFLADQIALQTNSNIQLSVLDIHPLDTEGEYGELNFLTKQVLIVGYTKSSVYSKDFLEKLRALKWVMKAELVDYTLTKDGFGKFKIKLFY